MEEPTMAQDDLVIDPWGSAQSTDYDRIIEQFGLTSMTGVSLRDRKSVV